MNTSRDIEKLFEHFGGNAGEYQEIGKENEARSARTRWPLLATLDFTQPPIPEVAQRRDVQLPTARSTPTDEAAPTPINRGKPPLFARAHRRTIPPIPNVALPPVAPRFAETAEAAPEALAATAPAPAPAPLAPAAPHAFAPRQTEAPLRASLPRMPTAPTAPVVAKPASIPMTNRAPASPSILGKLFTAPATEAAPQAKTPAADSKSLSSVFDRLRSTSASQEAPQDDNSAAARVWATSRTPR